MNKKEIGAVLEEIALLLELSGENPFKIRSYVNGARVIEQLDEDLETLVREKRLRELKGIGEALEKKIEELVDTGKLGFLEKLRAQFPATIYELFHIPGLGPKRIKEVYEQLGVDSLEKLERACRENRIATLKGFSDKLQAKILSGLAFTRSHEGQYHLDSALEAAQTLLSHLRKDRSILRIELAGSLRRRKELIKDIDVLASSRNPERLMDRFVKMPGIQEVLAHGDTKSSVILASGIAADLRVVSDKQFPYALAYFTGSKQHNIVMRQRAKERDLKLNEYGLFRADDSLVPCKDEAEIFKALGLPFIPPELREDTGEFEAETMPSLVDRGALKGIIHFHTTYSDGVNTIAEMALACRERGYTYAVVCDHSQSAGYANGLTPARVAEQHADIDRLNQKSGRRFRFIKGIECDIRTDGSLDYDDTVLRTFEVVIASIHSKLAMDEKEATTRIVKAVENPHTNILGHPTGRLLLARPGYPLDYDKVFDACRANRVAIEINSNCKRLDLDWRHMKRAKQRGLKFAICPDAHAIEGLDDVEYGLGIARKGWLEAGDVLNCMIAEELLQWCHGK